MKRTELKRKSWMKRSEKPLPKVNTKRKAKRNKEYKKHLASKFWKTLRYLIWQRCGGVCERCKQKIESFSKMHGAHKGYMRFGKENLDDVDATCAHCNMLERALQSYKGTIQ